MVRINFDEDSCIGSGICESLVADVFRTGDDGLTTLQREVVGGRPTRRTSTGSFTMSDRGDWHCVAALSYGGPAQFPALQSRHNPEDRDGRRGSGRTPGGERW